MTEDEPAAGNELVLSRTIDAPRDAVWRCWTEPVLLQQWFAPRPWQTTVAEIDLRPGGATLIVMRGPNGEESRNPGVCLEVVPNEKLVLTDAYAKAWEPSEKPFMTTVLSFADAGNGKTAYSAQALHWTTADREAHEKMGFHEGWGKASDQLEQVAQGL